MLKKLLAYLTILGIGLGVVAAGRDLARDAKPIHPDGCCIVTGSDIVD